MTRKKTDHFEQSKKARKARARQAHKAAAALDMAFDWSETKEGFDYWENIWGRLDKIAFEATQDEVSPS